MIASTACEDASRAQSAAATAASHRRARRLNRRHTSAVEPSSDGSHGVVPQINLVSFLSGLTAGVCQAGLFNPFDRALYLSVKNEVPFLTASNFQSPYQGFFQSVGHRALSGGLYYPLEQFFMTLIPPEATRHAGSPGALHNLLAGTAAGSVNAILCNPISAIKYKTWGREVNHGMFNEAMEMLRKGGARPFGNGLIPTVVRDLVFGGTYTFLRFEIQYIFQLPSEYQSGANFVAAALATVLSGPFNLARNVQYATKSRNKADSVSEVLTQFGAEVTKRKSFRSKFVHIQNRLRLGWGTARVALGMSFGHYVYDRLILLYEENYRR